MLVEALENRLLPTLEDTDIAHEAEAVTDEVAEKLSSMPADENMDMAALAEDPQNAGVSHYVMLMGIRQGLINMFAAALYHTFEQHLLQFHRREVLSPHEESNHSLFKVSALKIRLQEHGIDLESLPSWRKLDELRLVANVVKHAEGDSAEQLRIARPDLFEAPSLNELDIEVTCGKPTIFLPLAGEDLYVGAEDIRSYEKAIASFWDELVATLERV